MLSTFNWIVFFLISFTHSINIRSNLPCNNSPDCQTIQTISSPTTLTSSSAKPIAIQPFPTSIPNEVSAQSVIQNIREELHKRHKRKEHHLKLKIKLQPVPKPLPKPPSPSIVVRPKRIIQPKLIHPKLNVSLDDFLHPVPKPMPLPRKIPPFTTINITQPPACPVIEPWSPTDPNHPIVPDLRVPGTLAFTQDSPFVHTSCDLRKIVGPFSNFPRITIQGKQFDVLESPKDARTITLGDTYCGNTITEENVRRIPIGKDIDHTQDWVEVESCRVQVTNGQKEAYTDCDISTNYLVDGGVDNGECVRIDCNQYTLIEGGGTYNSMDSIEFYEEKRTCNTAFGKWKGNIKQKQTTKGGDDVEDADAMPQHRLVVEVAGAKDVTSAKKKMKNKNKNKNMNMNENDLVGDITNNIEEEIMKSVEESNRRRTATDMLFMLEESHRSSLATLQKHQHNLQHLQQHTISSPKEFHGNDQISMNDLRNAARSLRNHYLDIATSKQQATTASLTPIYQGLQQVRTTTQMLALLQSVIAGLSPNAVFRAVTAAKYLDVNIGKYSKRRCEQCSCKYR